MSEKGLSAESRSWAEVGCGVSGFALSTRDPGLVVGYLDGGAGVAYDAGISEERTTRLRPDSLARYSASSAFFSSASGLPTPAAGKAATPDDMVIRITLASSL